MEPASGSPARKTTPYDQTRKYPWIERKSGRPKVQQATRCGANLGQASRRGEAAFRAVVARAAGCARVVRTRFLFSKEAAAPRILCPALQVRQIYFSCSVGASVMRKGDCCYPIVTIEVAET